jgi:hypothetical protein
MSRLWRAQEQEGDEKDEEAVQGGKSGVERSCFFCFFGSLVLYCTAQPAEYSNMQRKLTSL